MVGILVVDVGIMQKKSQVVLLALPEQKQEFLEQAEFQLFGQEVQIAVVFVFGEECQILVLHVPVPQLAEKGVVQQYEPFSQFSLV
jgi:hypothetical protein